MRFGHRPGDNKMSGIREGGDKKAIQNFRGMTNRMAANTANWTDIVIKFIEEETTPIFKKGQPTGHFKKRVGPSKYIGKMTRVEKLVALKLVRPRRRFELDNLQDLLDVWDQLWVVADSTDKGKLEFKVFEQAVKQNINLTPDVFKRTVESLKGCKRAVANIDLYVRQRGWPDLWFRGQTAIKIENGYVFKNSVSPNQMFRELNL